MAANAESAGHVYNIDPAQNKILRRFWCKFLIDLEAADLQAEQAAADAANAPAKQQTRSYFSFSSSSAKSVADTAGPSGVSHISGEPPVAKTLDETWWLSIQYDHPDSLPLRFIRARKWDVEKAVAMLVNSVVWRKEFGVLDLIKTGESALDADEIRLGKFYFYKTDKEGRPLAVIHVRLHDKNTVNQELTRRFTTSIMEDGRLIMKDPVETATLVFDLTGFGTNNGDLPFTKFLVSTLEAHYPESLGAILILNAPWIFQGFWTLLRPLLDPVVASKVHFVKTEDLPKFIDPENIPSSLDPVNGKDYKFQFIEPTEKELEQQKRVHQDAAGYEAARKQFDAAVKKFKEKTKAWAAPEFTREDDDDEEVELEGQQSQKDELRKKDEKVTKERTAASLEMLEAYTKLAPFIRAKTQNHRVGYIDESTRGWTFYKKPAI